jgi:cytidylate kinase
MTGSTAESGAVRPRVKRESTMAVIAMTREIGSRGMEVAAGVAARLGLKIIRSESVADSVAERLGIKASAFLRYMDGSASLFERWQIDCRKLVHYTAEEILRVAQQGNVLIKGWGAATLLRDLPQVISVRVCAPMDFRVRVVMGRLGSADARAVREEIERQDAVRARTIAAYCHVEHEDARLYHLVLNTERLTIETCVKTIVELAESPRFRGHWAVRSALADKLVEAKIGSAFAEQISPSMAPLGIAVSVADGKVTLRGVTSSGALRRRAETLAHTVAGAFQIDNRIVSVPSHGRF